MTHEFLYYLNLKKDEIYVSSCIMFTLFVFEIIEMPLRKILTAVFYRKANGVEPVREWLKLLTKSDKKIIGKDISEVECNWPVGLPKVKHLEKKLWEVRSNVTENKSARIFFTTDKNNMILLHGFFKKSRKTPPHELVIAHERKNDIAK